jgi:hypothetical protein
MKTLVGRNWYQSIHLMNCLAGKCPFQVPNGHRHEKSKNIFSVFSTLTLSQPVGLVIFLSGKICVDFCYSVGWR